MTEPTPIIDPANDDAEYEVIVDGPEMVGLGEGEWLILDAQEYRDAGFSAVGVVGGDLLLHRLSDHKVYKAELAKGLPPKSGLKVVKP